MYNDKYIGDFSEEMYLKYLSSPEELKQIADAYINQYQNPTYDSTIAFKESLDHYVLKQIKNNRLNSDLLKNYYDHIFYIYNERKSKGNIHLEYNTNIVLRDETGKKILMMYYEKYHSDINRNKLVESISKNDLILENISNKIRRNEILTQIEIDLLSDYLYTSRNLNNEIYSKFIEYLLNNNLNINNSPQLMAAYIAYLPQIFGDNCEESRIILSNGYTSDNPFSLSPSYLDKKRKEGIVKYRGLYSHSNKFISIDWNKLKDISLNSDESLNISRTTSVKDLYWISMVCFHELTHQIQTKLMNSPILNSSGLSQIIKYAKHDKTDNTLNHDSIESEIEADENAWKKMADFISKYRLRNTLLTDRDSVMGQIKKCYINKEAVFARRAIQTKYNSDERFFASDMKIIDNHFKNLNTGQEYKQYFKQLLLKYPMMNKIFNEDGKVKTTLLLNENITSRDLSGNDKNIMSCELSDYILTEGYESLKKHVLQDELSETQVQNLMINIYNTYHLNKMFIRSLSKVDLSQYKDTKTNFDLNNIRNKYLEKFRDVARLVYRERKLIHIIKSRYPDYDVEKYADPKFAMWNFMDMFNYLYNSSNGIINIAEISDIISNYEKSQDNVLVELANQAKSIINNKKADLLVQAMANGQIDTDGQPIIQNQGVVFDNKIMGFAKIWVLGILTTMASIGIIVMGVFLNKTIK